MLIHPDYIAKIQDKRFDDQEFLLLYIWQIINYSPDEMALVKNRDCEFLAFTDKMASEFNLNESILGKTFRAETRVPSEVTSEILRQEQHLIKNAARQTSFYFYRNQDGKTRSYLVRKRALKNPDSGNVVGILVNTEPAAPNLMRKFLVAQDSFPQKMAFNFDVENLSTFQKQVILCMIIGISSRKEIAQMLSRFSGNEVSEIKVKNAIQALYKEFHCSTIQQLSSNILSNHSLYEFAEYPITPGNYLL